MRKLIKESLCPGSYTDHIFEEVPNMDDTGVNVQFHLLVDNIHVASCGTYNPNQKLIVAPKKMLSEEIK